MGGGRSWMSSKSSVRLMIAVVEKVGERLRVDGEGDGVE